MYLVVNFNNKFFKQKSNVLNMYFIKPEKVQTSSNSHEFFLVFYRNSFGGSPPKTGLVVDVTFFKKKIRSSYISVRVCIFN